jgi:hypothetical protein
MVGVTRFERATHCSQSSCATGLRYTPNPLFYAVLQTSLFAANFCEHFSLNIVAASRNRHVTDMYLTHDKPML